MKVARCRSAHCRAASTDLFLYYFAEFDLTAVLKAYGAALTLVMPLNHELDSVDQDQRLAEQLASGSDPEHETPTSKEKCRGNRATKQMNRFNGLSGSLGHTRRVDDGAAILRAWEAGLDLGQR